MQVVLRREAFERNPQDFMTEYADAQDALRAQIVSAKKLLSKVVLTEDLLRKIADLCMRLGTDGLRGELSLMRAAKAALRAAKKVSLDIVREVAPMALRHRLRRDPLDDTDATVRVQRLVDEVLV